MDGTLQPRYLDVPFVRAAAAIVRGIADAPFVVRIALLFLGVLGMVAAFPARPAAHALSDAEIISTPAPFHACTIDRIFDAAARRCVPAKPTPVPCVQSATGRCMATTASMPTPAPEPASQPVAVQQPADPFAGIMGITRDR